MQIYFLRIGATKYTCVDTLGDNVGVDIWKDKDGKWHCVKENVIIFSSPILEQAFNYTANFESKR